MIQPGNRNNIKKKWKIVEIKPNSIYGVITGRPPIHPNKKQFIKKSQIKKLYNGLNNALFIKVYFIIIGKNNKNNIKQSNKKIPNNLLVTALKIA